jgi:hypothetical protein
MDLNLLKVIHYMFQPVRSSSGVLKLKIINEETGVSVSWLKVNNF